MNEWINASVDNAAASRVRERVLHRIQRRRWAKRAGVAALLIGAIIAWPRMPEAETLALAMPPAPIAPAVSRAPKPIRVVRSKPAEKIVLYTNDPNVVIVLVSEGGSE